MDEQTMIQRPNKPTFSFFSIILTPLRPFNKISYHTDTKAPGSILPRQHSSFKGWTMLKALKNLLYRFGNILIGSVSSIFRFPTTLFYNCTFFYRIESFIFLYFLRRISHVSNVFPEEQSVFCVKVGLRTKLIGTRSFQFPQCRPGSWDLSYREIVVSTECFIWMIYICGK